MVNLEENIDEFINTSKMIIDNNKTKKVFSEFLSSYEEQTWYGESETCFTGFEGDVL